MPLDPVRLESLVETVQHRLANKREGSSGICPFVGAGISISAGIGSAAELVARIKQSHPTLYRTVADQLGVDELSYAQAMTSIPLDDQIAIIRDEIGGAKLN